MPVNCTDGHWSRGLALLLGECSPQGVSLIIAFALMPPLPGQNKAQKRFVFWRS